MTEDLKQEQDKPNKQTATAEQVEEKDEQKDITPEDTEGNSTEEVEPAGDKSTQDQAADEAEVEEAPSDVDEEAEGETTAGETSDEEAVEDEEIDEEASADEPIDEEEDAEEEIATFDGDVDEDEKVYTFDQLQEASEDYTDDEFHEYAEMYEGTLSKIEEKEIVTGRVVSFDEDYVIVDIGFKSEGIVQTNEFPKDVIEKLAPGDEIDVFLDQVEDQEGQLILSRQKADILHAWEAIQNANENNGILEGHIHRRIKGGMVVDIMGIDAFLPGSQIDVRPVRDFDAYVGRTMEFQVVKLNMNVENVVVSHRALIESDLEEQREEILSTIQEGQVLEGMVKNITDFGVFIDLGGVDGLLHITDLSWGRVDHPSEIVSLDQRMNVAVIDFDEESKRVSLGLKQLQPQPWNDIDIKYPEGMKVQGRVVSIADYGAFIELEKGVEGLIHISEMSWTQHIKHPSQLVDRDDIIECIVLNVNAPEKKISLGVKQLEKDPWEDIEEQYPIGSKHKGTVRNLTNFGVFVELEPGIDGLIHISDLSWTKQIDHPGEVVEKDEEIEVVILAIDYENRRITLGHKQVESNPWEAFSEEFGLTSEVSGEVAKLTDKGVFLDLPHSLQGFIPKSKTDAEGELEDHFETGDEVTAYIIELEETSKNITLSQLKKDTENVSSSGSAKREKKERTKTPEKTQTGDPTLGEMSGLSDLKEEMEEKERKETERKIKEHRQKEEAEKKKAKDKPETEDEEE